MHPTATPFTALCTVLAPQAGDNARPQLRVGNALLALLFQQLDRIFASLERLFAAWQAGTLPPPPPPRARDFTPRAALPRPARRHARRHAGCKTQPAPVCQPIIAPGTSAIIPASACQRQHALAPRATPQYRIPHHGPDPPHPPLQGIFSPLSGRAPPLDYIVTIS